MILCFARNTRNLCSRAMRTLTTIACRPILTSKRTFGVTNTDKCEQSKGSKEDSEEQDEYDEYSECEHMYDDLVAGSSDDEEDNFEESEVEEMADNAMEDSEEESEADVHRKAKKLPFQRMIPRKSACEQCGNLPSQCRCYNTPEY